MLGGLSSSASRCRFLRLSTELSVFDVQISSTSCNVSRKYLHAYLSRVRAFSFVGRTQITHSVWVGFRKHSETKQRCSTLTWSSMALKSAACSGFMIRSPGDRFPGQLSWDLRHTVRSWFLSRRDASEGSYKKDNSCSPA